MGNTNALYNSELGRNQANYQALTPLSFLARAATVFPDNVAIIHDHLEWTYQQFFQRSCQLASALAATGVGRGDTVSVMLANTPAMLECHHGIPMCQAVIHSINTRLDPAIIAFQLDHAQSKLVVVDSEFLSVMMQALTLAAVKPLLVVYDDSVFKGTRIAHQGLDYQAFVSSGDKHYAWKMPEDEWDAISINYTSGTTGNPKGVVSHHRGAYLLAQGNALTTSMSKHALYLWTLPMFHCNGWCFPWTMSVVAGSHLCLRQVRAESIWQLLNQYKVDLMCGAPIVMSVILEGQLAHSLTQRVQFLTAAAPPPEKVLADMDRAGFDVVHLYGLTETYGPAVVNDWHNLWDKLPAAQQATLKARQGVRYLPLESLAVHQREASQSVKADGKEIGEVVFRGNVVMKGYFKNPTASQQAFANGWFHSGDLAVLHPDGYIQLKDRSKDIIISGGENISSIEIEEVLYKHPSVAVAAVVAISDEKWGECPCAFVEVVDGALLTEHTLNALCREQLAGFKVPKRIEFCAIPRTATGKIKKYELRQIASALNCQ